MSVLSRLTPAMLRRARAVVKQTHMAHYPNDFITDREADRIIEAIGPQALEAATKLVVDMRGQL